jgi:hypothetical protein
MVVAIVALVVATAGSAYAIAELPRNSVGARQIRTGGVRASEIHASAVRASEVRNGSLGVVEFKASDRALLRGPKGDRGDPGGGAANVVVRIGVNPGIPNTGSAEKRVNCEPGEKAVGGGGGFVSSSALPTVAKTAPVTGSLLSTAGQVPDGWFVRARNNSGATSDLQVYALCASP